MAWVFDADALTITGQSKATQGRANYPFEAADSANGLTFLFFSIEVLPDPVVDRPEWIAFYQATGGAGCTNNYNCLSDAPSTGGAV